jgi:hypothetical protein
MEPLETYLEIGRSIAGSTEGQLFGKRCFKTGGKPFICFFEESMVFKLTGDEHQEALSLDGSTLFDPSKKHRPMKEWVQLPAHYSDRWPVFAEAAFAYVSQLS